MIKKATICSIFMLSLILTSSTASAFSFGASSFTGQGSTPEIALNAAEADALDELASCESLLIALGLDVSGSYLTVIDVTHVRYWKGVWTMELTVVMNFHGTNDD